MKLVGKVTVLETGHEVGQLRILVINAAGEYVAQTDTSHDGRFERDIGQTEQPRFNIAVCPPNTNDVSQAIFQQVIELGPDVTELPIQIEQAAFAAADIPTQLEWAIKRIRFSDGSDIEVAARGLTLIVGPNGAGKTRALREITDACVWYGSSERYGVSSVVMEPAHPHQWLIRNWIRQHFPFRVDGGMWIAEFAEKSINTEGVTYSAETCAFLVHAVGVEERLQFSHHHVIGQIDQAPESMVDHVLRDDAMCGRLSAATRSAFGVDLLPEFGRFVGFRVGERTQLPNADRASGTHRRALLALPRLCEAGDGLRSFVGTLIALEACPHPILLIDEPEVLLHPPQARQLGRRLAEASRTRQVIVATHSAEIVLGALSVGGTASLPIPSIQIVRVQRQGDANHGTSLDPSSLLDLAQDPQWESAELIQAMFHRGAVLCEADADRRFYRALAGDADVAFVACNGKGGIAKAAAALRQLGVPVAAIADFDVVSNPGELRTIIDGLGGDPKSVLRDENAYAAIQSQLTTRKPRSMEELTLDLEQLLRDPQSSAERPAFLRRLAAIHASAKTGYEAKKHGIDTLRGPLHVKCKGLLQELAGLGMFVVPRGELEGWNPAGPADKNEWIADAWELLRRDDVAFADARSFIGEVTKFVLSKPP